MRREGGRRGLEKEEGREGMSRVRVGVEGGGKWLTYMVW